MHLEGQLEKQILFLADGKANFKVGVKAHSGAGTRDVLVPRLHASGELIETLITKDLSPEEIVLAAFAIREDEPHTYIPQRGVRLEVHLPGEGILTVRSHAIAEVEV